MYFQHELLEGRFRFVDLYTRRSNRIGCFEISVAVVDADDESVIELDHSFFPPWIILFFVCPLQLRNPIKKFLPSDEFTLTDADNGNVLTIKQGI